MRDWIRAACEIAIYAAERVLEVLDAERPLHDEPLPEGHTDHWPDGLWIPPGGSQPTLIFDTQPVDRSGARRPDGSLGLELPPVHEHLLRRATTQWGNRSGDPRMN